MKQLVRIENIYLDGKKGIMKLGANSKPNLTEVEVHHLFFYFCQMSINSYPIL